MRWEIQLDRIAQEHLELPLRGRAHDTLGDLAGHARVQFDGDQFLGLLQDAHADVARARTDLEDCVGRFQVRLLHDGIGDTGVLEDVLANVCVELKDIVLGGGGGGGSAGFLGGAIVGCRGGGGCAFALRGCFAHCVWCSSVAAPWLCRSHGSPEFVV